jgi:hypothetical protein
LKHRIKHIALLFEISLLLTQSVGAIAAYILGWALLFVSVKKWKSLAVLLGISTVGAALLIYIRGAGQIAASYLDRIIQISDGTAVALRNPLGIGPGLWSLRVLELQSAFYSSAKMHSYLIELAVDAGIPAVAVFVWFVVVWIKKIRASGLKPRHIAAVMLLFHGLLDITFNYLTVIILLFIFVAPDFPDGVSVPAPPRRAVSAALLVFCVMTAVGSASAIRDARDNSATLPAEVLEEYESKRLKTALNEYRYAKALLYLDRYDEAADAAIRCIRLSRFLPDGYELLESIISKLDTEQSEEYRITAGEIREEAERTEHPLYKYLTKYKNSGTD